MMIPEIRWSEWDVQEAYSDFHACRSWRHQTDTPAVTLAEIESDDFCGLALWPAPRGLMN
jgi:hypothetical protein